MNITERLFNRLMVGVVLLGFMGLFGVGIGALWMVKQNEEFTGWVSHTYLVEQRLAELRVNLEQAEVARRGFLIQQDDSFYSRYLPAATNLPVMLGRIADLTSDNPAQQRRVAEQRALIEKLVPMMEQSIELARQGKAAQVTRDFRNDGTVEVVRRVRDLTSQMAAEEARLLVTRTTAQQNSEQIIFVILAAGGALVMIVGVASVWVIMRYTRDLTASRNALSVMNLGLEAAVTERTADFKRANEEIQRFAYIVSHDLRSPLVNVMGFTAELDAAAKPLSDLLEKVEAEAPQIVTEDARQAIRVDLPESIGFIRSSTQKMDRLINAILRLSREGRRVISPEKLNMQALLNGVADGIRHQAATRNATVEIKEPLPDIVSDRVAVEQIFSNLVENAVKYLAKDRPGLITVSGRVQGDHVVYEVQDNGRGIDPKDHDRVFDLFRRSGTQDQPGEGIGLAHVRALAYRLGGLITCDSALDRGATFRLSLPKVLTLERGTPL